MRPVDCLLPGPTPELVLVAWDSLVLSQRWSYLLEALSSTRYAVLTVRSPCAYWQYSSTQLPLEELVSSGQETTPALAALAGYVVHELLVCAWKQQQELMSYVTHIAG